MVNFSELSAPKKLGVAVLVLVLLFLFVLIFIWIPCAAAFGAGVKAVSGKDNKFNDNMIFKLTVVTPFTDLLEATLAPGAQQRYDTSLSHTGADGNTENQKLNLARAQAMPVVAKSGLTGSREAPYFPEGSMYNIEGKRVGASVTAGEGFRSKFDAAKLEENVYG
jgi:hypothetical protein